MAINGPLSDAAREAAAEIRRKARVRPRAGKRTIRQPKRRSIGDTYRESRNESNPVNPSAG